MWCSQLHVVRVPFHWPNDYLLISLMPPKSTMDDTCWMTGWWVTYDCIEADELSAWAGHWVKIKPEIKVERQGVGCGIVGPEYVSIDNPADNWFWWPTIVIWGPCWPCCGRWHSVIVMVKSLGAKLPVMRWGLVVDGSVCVWTLGLRARSQWRRVVKSSLVKIENGRSHGWSSDRAMGLDVWDHWIRTFDGGWSGAWAGRWAWDGWFILVPRHCCLGGLHEQTKREDG